MSTKSNERNSTVIKLENDVEDDFIYDTSVKFNLKKDYYSTSPNLTSSLSTAYKGKIEVTSKGRRKIFDGVRWQILCRRPECRKQTNKKSLCITHYKEEYEANIRSSPWPSFQVPSYSQQSSFDHLPTRFDIEDQNDTITTTNMTDNNEQISFQSHNQTMDDGYIKYMHSGRRFMLKNSKWQPLCKYDDGCRNMAKYDLFCYKHYELTQEKRQKKLKGYSNESRRALEKYYSSIPNEKIKRLKANDFSISSSSVTEQFDINSNENSCSSTEPQDATFSTFTSKLPDHALHTSSTKNLNITSCNHLSFDQSNCPVKTDQSVQTDLTIPLCCVIHQKNHSIFSLCQTNRRP